MSKFANSYFGTVYVHQDGIGLVGGRMNIDDARSLLTALGEAIEYHDSEMDRITPKPGVFEVGDRVRNIDPGESSFIYRVGSHRGNKYLIDENGWTIHSIYNPSHFIRVD